MSRTLDTSDPPRQREITTASDPSTTCRAATDADSPAGERLGRPRRLALLLAATLVLATIGALVWSRAAGERNHAIDPIDPIESIDYHAAVALEQGVRPLVSDRAGELGTVTAVAVKRTPDLVPARGFLLARIGDDRPALSVISDADPAELVIDGLLADGRPYEVYRDEGAYVSLATVGAGGHYVEMMGRAMTFDELVTLAADITVTLRTLDRLPAGWFEAGSTPMPPWYLGFSTSYEYLGGRRLGITVERASPGRDALAAFGPTEPVELGTGGWAYRLRPPSSGVIFERGDTVVQLSGDFSEAELLIVAHSLREMVPLEHPIDEPDPYPF